MTGFNILQGDCLDVIPTLDDRSIDSIVTDPPYGLSFMGKDWDYGVPGVHFWVEALRVAKPGAYLLAFGGTRTFHRLTVAIEDAGWEIRDCIGWIYGSGFPKSLDVSKAIDKAAGEDRKVIGSRGYTSPDIRGNSSNGRGISGPENEGRERLNVPITAPATEAARQWEGWGTSLKPAWEPIIVARKPIIGTVAANVLKYGTGAMNIDGCRVGTEETITHGGRLKQLTGDERTAKGAGMFAGNKPNLYKQNPSGRFPANIIHDGSEEVLSVFPETKSGLLATHHKTMGSGGASGFLGVSMKRDSFRKDYGNDSGSAARFFYCAKASKQDRDEGCGELPLSDCGMMEDDNYPIKTGSGNLRETKRHNNHPTVKPTALMRYLCKLVTPPGGTILDPFMGSGSTGKAAALEGFRFIGIELESDYTEIAGRRIKAVQPLFAGASL